MDARGRLAGSSCLRVLGWLPGQPIAITAIGGVAVVAAGGLHRVSRQGWLRLPADVRHACRLTGGDRLLVIACPDSGLLVAYPPTMVDAMVLAHTRGLEGRR